MAEFNMEAAVAEIGGGLELGDDDGLASGSSDGGGDDTQSDLGEPADPGTGVDSDAAGGTPAQQDQPVDKPAGAGEPAPVGGFVPPKTWTPAAAEALKAASPLIQAEVAKREEDMFRGLEGYKADANLGKVFHTIVSPHMALMQQHGVDPQVLIPNLLDAHKILSLGSAEQKLTYFRQLAADYGIPLEQAAAEAPYVDPEVQRLTIENRRLQSERQREQQQAATHARSTAAQTLDAFIADPKNIYFEEVGNDIAKLLEGGVCKTLQEAYEKAVWANPVTRAFTELVSTTFRNHSKEIKDNVSKNNALLRRLTEKGKIRKRGWRPLHRRPLDYASNGTYQRYSGFDVLNVAASDVISAAEFAWKQIAVNVVALGPRAAQQLRPVPHHQPGQGADEQRDPHVQERPVSSDMYSDGTATNQIGGCKSLVADAGTGTVGGIDSSSFVFWKNIVQSAAAPLQGGAAITVGRRRSNR
jgi:hypothetical protein